MMVVTQPEEEEEDDGEAAAGDDKVVIMKSQKPKTSSPPTKTNNKKKGDKEEKERGKRPVDALPDMTGKIIFHTYPDAHTRKLSDIIISEDSANYLGQATVNSFGTEFTVHDHRGTPDKANSPLHELGVVRYSQNILGRVPNFMTCLVPRPEAEHERGEARRVAAV